MLPVVMGKDTLAHVAVDLMLGLRRDAKSRSRTEGRAQRGGREPILEGLLVPCNFLTIRSMAEVEHGRRSTGCMR